MSVVVDNADNTTVGFDAPAASAMLTPALKTMIAEVDASPATAAVDDIATLAFPTAD